MIKKFKVWDKEEEKWSQDYFHFSDNGLLYINHKDNLDTEYISCNYKYLDRYEIFWSTGLTDKKGVEIYEGDVVRVGNKYNLEILYINGMFSIITPHKVDEERELEPIGIDVREGKINYEILGHIKTNPELLKNN